MNQATTATSHAHRGPGSRVRYMTYHRLASMSSQELEKTFTRGHFPNVNVLEGWEFRGWNVSRLTRILGFQKFKKGFRPHEGADLPVGQLHGYNVVVRQNRLTDPHVALPNELEPKRHGFYLVKPVERVEIDHLYPQALLLDYGRGPDNPKLDPSSLLRDYLVQPDPDNPDLYLGKAYLALGHARVSVGFFVLERYNRIGL